jgi:transglutaminase-like putative cysteine protease
MLLYDVSVEVNRDWSYTTREHKKIKILKEDAKDLGEIELWYEKGRENVIEVKAQTITPDGKKYPYSKIQDLQKYKGFPMYSDQRVKVITLPEVNVGAVLEYETTVVSKGLPIKNAFWYYDSFDFSIPTKEVRLTVSFPKELNIRYKEFNLKYKPKITENGSGVRYSWDIKEIGEYEKAEGLMPPPSLDLTENYIEFSSIPGWKDISEWYYALVEKNTRFTPEIEKAAKEVLTGKETVKDKVRAVLEYIQDNFRYVSMSFGDHALKPHPTDEVFRNKYGDCKDLSILCKAMLAAGGVKSYVAIFGDEFSRTDPQYDLPIISFFDHVLLLVIDPQGGNFYADPLLKGYDIGEYPSGYQAAYTLVITEDGGKFGRLPVFDEKRNYAGSENSIIIYEDGSILSEKRALNGLDFSIDLREMLKALNDKQKEEFYEMLDDRIAPAGEVLERRIEGLEKKYGTLTTYSKVKIPEYFPVTDGMIIIDIGGIDRSSSFVPKERKNPIFFPGNYLYENKVVYRIPKGFCISYLPGNLDLNMGFLSFKRHYKRKAGEITITQLTRYKRMELPKEKYNELKGFFNQLPKKTEQRIVLKKKKPLLEEIKDFFKGLKKD